MIQQGQVFKLKATSVDGEPLWAYRYRVAGRDSVRRQAGGFTTKAEAQRALQNRLARLLPGGRAETLTLAECVEEYLGAHQGERVTIAKLRWLLGKATAALGEVRLAELSPDQVSAWRLTVPEGHRFEATQALTAAAESSGQLEADRRQPRQARAKSRSALPGAAAVRLLAADPVARRATRADPWADGSVRRRDGASTLRAVRARTARRRPCSRRRPGPTRVRERASQAHEDAAQQTRRPPAGNRARGARPATGAGGQSGALPERRRRPP